MTASTKREIFNTRERVVSNDFNRSQAFISAALTDALRYLYDSRASEDDAGGLQSWGTVQTNPLRGIVLSGCRFRPEIGTANAFVTEGAVVLVDPEVPASTDDSAAKLIVDPGISVAGQLTLTAGAGSPRIDVVECAKVDEVLETNNVDIFNPATGLFSAVSNSKVARQRLQWRIRTGVAGAGFPGTVAGWLPVAVCVVAAGAATWDNVDVYDVRPLVSDLRRNQYVAANSGKITKSWASMLGSGGPPLTSQKLRGYVECEWQGRIAGGYFSNPNLNANNYVDVKANASSVLASGLTLVDGSHYFFYFAFPFGLPRWCKYSAASTGQRTPGAGPRGIFVVTSTAPSKTDLLNGSPINLPSGLNITGGQANAGEAICFGSSFAGQVSAGDVELYNFIMNRGTIYWTETARQKTPSSGANTSTPSFQIIDQNDIPPGATEVLVRIRTTISATGPADGEEQILVTVYGSGGNSITLNGVRHQAPVQTSGATTTDIQFEMWVPIDADSVNTVGGGNHTIQCSFGIPGATSYSAQTMRILGYRLGG